MSIAALMKQMRELGAPMEAIEVAVAAVEAEQAKDADRKAKRAAQKASERARRATVARQSPDSRTDVASTPAAPLDGPPLPPAPPSPPLNPPTTPVSEPIGSASPSAATPETDPRRDLFARGLAEIKQMTGMPEPRCRTLLGKWLKAADDSAVIVMAAIDSAAVNEVASAIPFIEMTIRSEAERNGSRTANLFGSRASGGRSQGTVHTAVTAGLARVADRRGLGSGSRSDDCRYEDREDNRPRRDHSGVEDADWSPAPGHRAAYR